MKRLLKIVIPILLVLAILVSTAWFFLQYDKEFTRNMLLSWARGLDDAGNHTVANWIYNIAYKQAGNDDAIAIEIAAQYKSQGNYTKAEHTLSNAISQGASVELYTALCKLYIEQDKLLDAVNMLDSIPEPSIKAQIDKLRPAAPSVNYPSGNYNNYISLSYTSGHGKVYANFENKYPSIQKNLAGRAYTLTDGVTTVQSICVGTNGLVSPLQIHIYTVTQVSKAIKLSDPAINRIVRELLNVDESYELYTDDLLTFESFMVPDDCASLEDLYYMPKLKSLILKGCAIKDLSPVGHLKELEELMITDTVLSPADIDTIASLETLKFLTASNCSLSGIKPLASLTALEYLDLSNNAIGDLSILKSMPALTYLDMSHNALKDLDHVASLQNLVQLNVSYNSLTSLSKLSNCKELRMLEAANNALTDLSGLEKAVNLGVLYVSSNKLTDISAISKLTAMADLDLSRNEIEDLSPIAKLSSLMMLNFAHNKITALPDMSECATLSEVNGSHNELTDASALAGVTGLTKLNMSYNADLKNIDSLVDCKNLTHIDVLETAVTDISAFKDSGITVLYNLPE